LKLEIVDHNVKTYPLCKFKEQKVIYPAEVSLWASIL
jgi:hypothetical protein